MLIYEDMEAVAASRAYELAQTGSFEDFAAIERELIVEGFGEAVEKVKKPSIERAISETCRATRDPWGL
jgi:hypothetical protein